MRRMSRVQRLMAIYTLLELELERRRRLRQRPRRFGGGGITGVTDHGLLSGLLDDDHTQYYGSGLREPDHADLTNVTAGQHHRKWSWADEQGWIKTFRLPLSDQHDWTREATNPVFEKSGSTGEFDDGHVAQPCVIRYDDKYWLFYTGRSTVGAEDYQIGVAYSTTPNGTYTRSASNPIIERGGVGSDDENRAYMPSVIYDEIADLWRMYYCGMDISAIKRPLYAYASDPEGPWTKDGRVTGLTDYHFSMTVNRLGNLIHGVFKETPSYDLVCAFASPSSPKSFTTIDSILSLGAGGSWDESEIAYMSLFWNSGVWYLMYSGYSSTSTLYKIGIATSGKGHGTFDKWPRNPVFNVGTGGAWDDKYVVYPSLLMVDDTFYMWYEGKDTGNVQQIGLATIP